MLRDQGHPLSRCRHERRRLGPRARLLHDDRRRPRRPSTQLDPIFDTLAPGRGTIERDAGPRAPRSARRAGLPALRAGRRRPLRQDDPQRHRVRADAGLRRGLRHPAQRQLAGAAGGAALSTSTSPTSPRSGGAAASSRSWLLDLTAMALGRRPGPDGIHRLRRRIRARAAGRSRRRSRRRCRPRCCRRRSTPASARARSTPSPRRSCRPCASKFGGHVGAPKATRADHGRCAGEQRIGAAAARAPAPPCAVVIFGASGDLTKRKLMPALYNLARDGLLPDRFRDHRRRPRRDSTDEDVPRATRRGRRSDVSDTAQRRRGVRPDAWDSLGHRA